MTYDVLVIGGGLAGSACAAHLARRGHAVLVLERARYPQHRLCGEFLSGEVQGLFDRLGVLPAVQAAGAVPIRHSRLTAMGGATFELPLPHTALGLSRFVLDPLLLGHAAALGAEVREGTSARRLRRDPDGTFVVETANDAFRARMVVGAWGKRANLDGTLGRPFVQKTTPWIGFKAHFDAGDALADQIDLHAFDGGYVGISHVEDGRTNVCWICSKDALDAAGGSPDALLHGAMRRNPHLARRVDGMTRLSGRYEAVAQVTFATKGTSSHGALMLGDTAGMIAPLCGDGMAMALHGAELAVPLLDGFLAGRLSEAELHAAYGQRWRERFRLRLRLGRALHALYVRPAVSEAALRLVRHVPSVGAWLARNTRG